MNDRDAHKTKFHALLHEQIYREFTNAQQYIAMAVYFDGADLRQLAKHFYAQALEERNHAMMLVQYLLDRDVRVEIPGVDTVRNQFETPRDALALALDQERAARRSAHGLGLLFPIVRRAPRGRTARPGASGHRESIPSADSSAGATGSCRHPSTRA